jgi:hypothetical protein
MSDDPSILAAIAKLRDDLTSRVDGLTSGIDGLRVDVMGRIDRLQDAVTGMRDDIRVNFARADRTRKRPTTRSAG